MWKDHSADYIRQTKSSAVSVVVATFISALFLSLLCSLAYNFWTYETEQIVIEEGDWQGRISGNLKEDDLIQLNNFANVEKVMVNENLSDGESLTVDIYFHNMRTAYEDMYLIAGQLHLDPETVSCHDLLLSRYLIHDPQDETPPLLLTFYLILLIVVSVSLILVIHNSFAVSMNSRIRQLGIISSVGATPRQIRAGLMRETAAVCTVPLFAGILLGILLSSGTIQAVNQIADQIAERHEAVFQYHPLIFLLTLLTAAATVFLSAWIPAAKLSRTTPLAAIVGTDEWFLKKKRKSPVLALLFGIEGELAGNALKAQRKAFRTSTLSLTLSFLAFTILLCFFTLSGISTNHTYFERYQNAWDIMTAIEDTEIDNFSQADAIHHMPGSSDTIIYQKAQAACLIPESELSDAVKNSGGLEALAGDSVSKISGTYQVSAPIVILDDCSFTAYCRQIGIEPDQYGTILLNQIWDSRHSDFRYREYLPFVQDTDHIVLQNTDNGQTVTLPVLAGTQKPPVLREEYEDYALVQFISASSWRQISNQIGGTEEDLYVRILAENRTDQDALNRIENQIADLLEQSYTYTIENRIQEKLDNDNMIRGYMLLTGAMCALLALIGIANVFSNTLSFLQQRKREFARYISIGMTPAQMRKLFCAEAFVIAGRPILITLPLTVIFVSLMITVSSLAPSEFWSEAPIGIITVFMLAVIGFVALAYVIGGRRIMQCNLTEALRSP